MIDGHVMRYAQCGLPDRFHIMGGELVLPDFGIGVIRKPPGHTLINFTPFYRYLLHFMFPPKMLDNNFRWVY